MTASDNILEMRRGDTPIFEILVTNANGTVFDITGCTIYFTAKRSIDDSDANAVISATTLNGGVIITDAPNGVAQAIPTAVSTSGLTIDENLFWDVQIKTVGGRIHTIANGILSVVRDITRAV